MKADYRVVLDACVLIPMPLADTLLRMAEEPRLYSPKWSLTMMGEMTRNLIAKWRLPPDKARRREEEIRRHFPEAWVDGFDGDRHVLAAAVRSHSDLIVTYNRRHFPPESLQRWEIDVQGPSAFLRGLYDLDAGLFVHEQAAATGTPLHRLLRSLARNVPGFVDNFCEEQGIGLPDKQKGAAQ